MSGPTVTLCVPAYEAGAFVAQTLRSALAQTHDAIRVVVSVDRSSDDTAVVCRSFEDDPRVSVHVQSERLGWVGNVNAALEHVESEYWSVLFHDDRIEPRYVEALLASASTVPGAVCHYPDMARFGESREVKAAGSLVGAPGERIAAQMARQTAVPVHGMMSRRVLDAGLRWRDHGFGGIGAGVVWVLECARLGECIRVPEPLYGKRISSGSVMGGFRTLPGGARGRAWIAMAEEMLKVVDGTSLPTPEREQAELSGLLKLALRLEGERRGGGLSGEALEAQLPELRALLWARRGVETIAALSETPSARDAPSAELAAALLVARAKLARRTGDGEEAAALLEQAADVDSRSATARYLLADAASRAHDHARAIAWARAAVQADGALLQPRVTLARVLLRAGARSAAVRAAEEGLALAGAAAARTRLEAVRERALRTRPARPWPSLATARWPPPAGPG